MNFDYVTNPSDGIGDCLSCFNTNRPIFSPSPHYATLRQYSSIPSLGAPGSAPLRTNELQEQDYAGEHLFNRVRIASGLEPLAEPRAQLDLITYAPVSTFIAFSFDVGRFAPQQTHLHPRPRVLYDEHRVTVQEFINKHSDKYNFVEVGQRSFGFANTINKTNISLDDTIKVLRRCDHYFGMHSGLMHLATAIGIPSTIIINFPTVAQLTTQSTVFDANDKFEQEKTWLYPQHRYLHEDETSGDYAITVANLESML